MTSGIGSVIPALTVLGVLVALQVATHLIYLRVRDRQRAEIAAGRKKPLSKRARVIVIVGASLAIVLATTYQIVTR